MKQVILLLIGFTCFAVNAKDIKTWYRDLKDPPGATLEIYSKNKLLPVEFLKRMGLKDFKRYTIGAEGIKKNGKEEQYQTTVDEESGKLTLPYVVITGFYAPAAGKTNEVFNDPAFDVNGELHKYVGDGVLDYMGHVARLTMSHKKPDKILRFYEKLKKLSIPSITGENVCSAREDKEQKRIPYGLWRLGEAKRKKEIYLVEGESSALTLWYNGYPALAFGGATKWHDNYMDYFDGIDTINILLEADSGGKNLLTCLRKVSAESDEAYQKFAKKVNLVVLGQFGDISDLHTEVYQTLDGLEDKSRQKQFHDTLASYVAKGLPLTHPGFMQKDGTWQKISTYDPKFRKRFISGKTVTEDVGDGIISGKLKREPDIVYKTEEIIPSATLQDYARKKKLPVSELIRVGFGDGIFPHRFLGPVFGVTMDTYKLPEGKTSPEDKELDYYRYRISMDSAQSSANRFPPILFNPDGSIRDNQKKSIYGLEYLPTYEQVGTIYFVEGESDTLTMRHYGFPTIGIPGTLEWKDEWAEKLKNVDRIVVSVENDTGGDHFLEVLTNSPLADKLILIDFTSVGKDPSDLHVELMKDVDYNNLEAFFTSDEYKQQRETIEAQFRGYLSKVLLQGVYWRDVKKYFTSYAAWRESFDEDQEKIANSKHSERAKCQNVKEAICPTHQQVDEKYLPWPFVDFYNGLTKQPQKTYYDQNDNPRFIEAIIAQ